MKKRILSDDEFNRVLRLKQSGTRWLKIQRETGVPRRIAKRAYEDWQRNQSFAELKESRRTVAAEVFREHIDFLIKVGKFLALHQGVPATLPSEAPQGAQIVDSLWESNVIEELQNCSMLAMPGVDVLRERRSITRQQRMLFEALQEHTRGELRWEALQEWEDAWDSCRQLYVKLGKEAVSVMQNFLSQEKGLENRIENGSRDKDAMTHIVDRLLREIWSELREDRFDPQRDIFEVIARTDNKVYVAVAGLGNSNFLTFSDRDLAEKAARLGNRVARNLLLGRNGGNVGKSLQERISKMRQAMEELADMLNPLVLRPIILRTRCELCPA